MRVLASLMLGFFFAATVVTGALSLGAYCLTSDGGDTRALRAGIELTTQLIDHEASDREDSR